MTKAGVRSNPLLNEPMAESPLDPGLFVSPVTQRLTIIEITFANL